MDINNKEGCSTGKLRRTRSVSNDAFNGGSIAECDDAGRNGEDEGQQNILEVKYTSQTKNIS